MIILLINKLPRVSFVLLFGYILVIAILIDQSWYLNLNSIQMSFVVHVTQINRDDHHDLRWIIPPMVVHPEKIDFRRFV